jgi:hypothetical protein
VFRATYASDPLLMNEIFQCLESSINDYLSLQATFSYEIFHYPSVSSVSQKQLSYHMHSSTISLSITLFIVHDVHYSSADHFFQSYTVSSLHIELPPFFPFDAPMTQTFAVTSYLST